MGNYIGGGCNIS